MSEHFATVLIPAVCLARADIDGIFRGDMLSGPYSTVRFLISEMQDDKEHPLVNDFIPRHRGRKFLFHEFQHRIQIHRVMV